MSSTFISQNLRRVWETQLNNLFEITSTLYFFSMHIKPICIILNNSIKFLTFYFDLRTKKIAKHIVFNTSFKKIAIVLCLLVKLLCRCLTTFRFWMIRYIFWRNPTGIRVPTMGTVFPWLFRFEWCKKVVYSIRYDDAIVGRH